MTIGERIKLIREQHKLTQTELADAIGTTKQNVYKYENGIVTNIPSDRIEAIAHFFKISPSYLMGWDDADTPEISLSSLSRAEFDIVEQPASFARIPVVGEVAAGVTSFADMQIIDYISCDDSILNDGYDYCYLKVKGDSMEPKISEDDLVLIRVQEKVDSGSYAVVLIDGDNGLVKRVEYDNEHLELISENPYYPPRKFYREEMNRVRIFGKVVKIERFL